MLLSLLVHLSNARTLDAAHGGVELPSARSNVRNMRIPREPSISRKMKNFPRKSTRALPYALLSHTRRSPRGSHGRGPYPLRLAATVESCLQAFIHRAVYLEYIDFYLFVVNNLIGRICGVYRDQLKASERLGDDR